MRKIYKLAIVTSVLTLLCAVPAFATTPEELMNRKESVTQKRTADQDEFMAHVNDLIPSDINDEINRICAERQMTATKEFNISQDFVYDNLLNGLKTATNSNVQLKKEIYDNYVNLSKVNPEFVALAEKALADYQSALYDQSLVNEFEKMTAYSKADHRARGRVISEDAAKHIIAGDRVEAGSAAWNSLSNAAAWR